VKLVSVLKQVSVVVSTYSVDRFWNLLGCIESLRKQSFKPVEVVLVLDPVPELVEFCRSRLPRNVKIVVSDKYGLSNARNVGVDSAKGEIIAFIDDDAVADVSWLENLVRNYADSMVVGVGGAIRPLWENKAPAWFPDELNWIVGCSYKGLPESRSLVRNPIGCNMSFRKSVFEKIGYFRADVGRFGRKLLAGEEPELSMRILERMPGSKIVYDPSAVVFHRISRDRVGFTYLFERSFYEGVSKALISGSERFSSKLSTEDEYLKYLLKVAVPSRLRRIYLIRNLCQLMVLLVSVFAVFLGFSTTKLTNALAFGS
jgi:glycosyltransferase involved in cell wall biosynthesis